MELDRPGTGSDWFDTGGVQTFEFEFKKLKKNLQKSLKYFY
jgi:hypothetical protein